MADVIESKGKIIQPLKTQDRTRDLAASTMQKIDSIKLKPTPEMYELWFRYFQGDPELMQAIDSMTVPPDEIACHKLYKRFLSETSREEEVKKVTEQVQLAIAEIASLLSSVKSATSDYGGSLGDVEERIRKASTLDELGDAVAAIVEDTWRMVEKNQTLELQLVNSSHQVSELRQNLDNVKKESMTDGLTGLYNRKAFDRYIRDCAEELGAFDIPLVLIMLDIDHFKTFNDTHGHQTGDQVLRLVARTLTDNVKGRDIAARYGGEEFAILLPETPLSAGIRVAERLRRSVESKELINKTNNENLGKITLSIGVSEYRSGEQITSFIARSDAALYDAKRSGRNQVKVIV